ncbi:hypothetical protein NGA_0358900 [Nannochloropsis gaditana CCMP526]|nr:hypothetical protein NGA_0358900 [Nannochloropsis gaditana CCMP526]EKU21477.1 hypothetical protein NGA_0358900 [Nannochloropsis gaditana CCMP526]|eukprot:XP_005854887.1 hypothetical protein NGA_0358900 [Nannochloropsis gaditana CCMP526]
MCWVDGKGEKHRVLMKSTKPPAAFTLVPKCEVEVKGKNQRWESN